MRKIIITAIMLSLVMISLPVFAARGGRKGADEQAYEHASKEAIFHRIGDWFATRGKSEEEKKAIIAERKAKRAAIRAQKEAERQERKMQKEAERQKRKAEKEAQKAQKKIKEKMKKPKKGSGRK